MLGSIREEVSWLFFHVSGLRVVQRLGGLAGMLKQRLSLREGVPFLNEWLGIRGNALKRDK